MIYHIAVCDDSPADRELLSSLAGEWASRRGHTLRLAAYPSAEAFVFAYAEDPEWDMLLLDIEMGGLDGVALARRVRRENEAVQIVFVTGYSEYLEEGYDVEALHYLMKPVKPEKLFAVLDRAAEKRRKADRALSLDLGDETVRLPLSRIRYADVRSNYVTVHAGRDYTVKMPLGELEKALGEGFFRVGRSAVVNLRQVARVTRTELFLTDGTTVPLPRGAYEKVNRAIIELR